MLIITFSLIGKVTANLALVIEVSFFPFARPASEAHGLKMASTSLIIVQVFQQISALKLGVCQLTGSMMINSMGPSIFILLFFASAFKAA